MRGRRPLKDTSRPPPSGWRGQVYRLLASGSALLAAAACYFALLEMAAILDGPGVGMFAKGPGGSLGLFVGLWIVGAIIFVVAARGLRSWRWTASLVLAGLLLFALLLTGKVAQRLCRSSWSTRCLAGQLRFCPAAAGVHKVLGDREAARRFYLRGCQHAVQTDKRNGERRFGVLCCRRLLEQRPAAGIKQKACEGLANLCHQKVAESCAVAQQLCRGQTRGPTAP